MKNHKSLVHPEEMGDDTVVLLSPNHKRGKSINEFIDKTLGNPSSSQREQYESELRMEVFQELIKAARKKRNLSQDELGNMIGVKKSQISKLEKGYDNASIAIISKVFRVLDAHVKVTVEMDGQILELTGVY